MAAKLAILVGMLALALPSAAQAATFCVNGAPGCVGQPHATLQLALAAADADTTAPTDRVEVAPGEYVGPFAAANPVEVVGAGRGTTVLRAGDGPTVLSLAAPGSVVRNLTVRLGGGTAVTGLIAPRAEELAIDSTAAPASGGFVGMTGSGALTADDVTIELNGGASTAVQVGLTPGSPATLRHVTISGEGTGLAVIGTPMLPAPSSATAILLDSVIHGVAPHIVTTGFDCDAVPLPCASTATVTTSYSAYDPANVASTGPGGVSVTGGTPLPVSADPRLDEDLRPRHDSPLIDAADPAGGGTADASGAPRVVDGDGDGGARSDIGALEYQRRAPVIGGAAATPANALAGAPIAFSATASDPDGEAVSAAWTFSDGAAATGLDVTHPFAAPGPASAELTVTDPAGVTAKTSVAVTIAAPPAGAGPPAKPRVLARVLPAALRLRAVARRDRRAPYRFRLRGRVVLPEGISAGGCKGGLVRLAIRAGKRRTTRSVQLAPDCRFRLTVKLRGKRARRVVVTPRFAGTATLTPRDGTALKLRAG